MTDLPSLISRLEAASENDVALFMDVYDAVTPSPTDDGTRTTYLSGGLRFLACLRCDAFLDAITALIERALPGWQWDVSSAYPPNRVLAHAQLWTGDDGADGTHPVSPAIALCLALVRAKAAMMETSE